jgi:hypothetical protein
MNELYYFACIVLLYILYFYVFKKYKRIPVLTHIDGSPFYNFINIEIE